MKFTRLRLIEELKHHQIVFVLERDRAQHAWAIATELKQTEVKQNQLVILDNLVAQLSALYGAVQARGTVLKSKELPLVPSPGSFPSTESRRGFMNECDLRNLIVEKEENPDSIKFRANSTVVGTPEFGQLVSAGIHPPMDEKTRNGYVPGNFVITNPDKKFPQSTLDALDKMITLLEAAEDEFVTSTGIEQLGMLPVLRRWVQ